MLLLDVSNICYTGSRFRSFYFGESSEYTLKSIVYFFEKVANYYSESKEMVAVFEGVGKIPALSKADGYKAGRTRNPAVEWEILALKEMLEAVGFPTITAPSGTPVEADHIIHSYCRKNRDKEDIIILSADKDMASNVCADVYETKILSFSANSYNINKSNFKEITGVEYNFMDLNKMLCGCSSDRIKAVPKGSIIFNAYINSVKAVWKRRFGFNKDEHTMSFAPDSLTRQYNTLDAFMNWFRNSSHYDVEVEQELMHGKRKDRIYGFDVDIPKIKPVNWKKYNNLISGMNLWSSCGVKAEDCDENVSSYHKLAMDALAKGTTSSRTMFEEQYITSNEEIDVVDMSGIRALLSQEEGSL